VAITQVCQARVFFRQRSQSGGPITLRQRLHVNTLITEPGTVELEWANSISTSGDFAMPSAFKYTPQGPHILWGRTEYSASFDMVSSTTQDNVPLVQFSDRLNFAATSVLIDGEKLDIAIAPQATVFLR